MEKVVRKYRNYKEPATVEVRLSNNCVFGNNNGFLTNSESYYCLADGATEVRQEASIYLFLPIIRPGIFYEVIPGTYGFDKINPYSYSIITSKQPLSFLDKLKNKFKDWLEKWQWMKMIKKRS